MDSIETLRVRVEALEQRVHRIERRWWRVIASLASFFILVFWTDPAYSLTESKFPAGSNAKNRDFFGSAVAVSGDFAVVGATAEPGDPYNPKVYFYQRTQTGWIEQAKFTSPDPVNDAVFFAESVAISGAYAI